MLRGDSQVPVQRRVHPAAPGIVALAGVLVLATGHQTVGAGIAIGALLAYVNGLLLSKRVDTAAMTGNVPGAMMVMQLGLLVTLTVVGIATYVLIRVSLSMAVAAAGGFAAGHLAILAMYYFLRVRDSAPTETLTT